MTFDNRRRLTPPCVTGGGGVGRGSYGTGDGPNILGRNGGEGSLGVMISSTSRRPVHFSVCRHVTDLRSRHDMKYRYMPPIARLLEHVDNGEGSCHALHTIGSPTHSSSTLRVHGMPPSWCNHGPKLGGQTAYGAHPRAPVPFSAQGELC